MVAALLTLVGYSMNDTIVVFDRIRENLKISRRESLAESDQHEHQPDAEPDDSDSGLTFLTALSLCLFGGRCCTVFRFALVVGIIVGTYSSIFVASPILVFWQDLIETGRRAPSAAASRAGCATQEINAEEAGSERPVARCQRRERFW